MKVILKIITIGLVFTYIKADVYSNLLKEGYHLKTKLRADITNDKLEDKIFLFNKKNTVKLIILINKGNKQFEEIIDNDTIVPMIKSIPEVSFKQVGFDVSIGSKNILYNVESEAIKFSINESNKKVLVLTSLKDGYLDRFKFYFQYSKQEKKFHLYKVYFLSFNESCGYDLNAIYEVKNKIFEKMTLDNFDGKAIHKFLYVKPVWINKEIQLSKIQSLELQEAYREIFKLYKNKQINFQEYVGDFINESCSFEYYLDEKYFFHNNIEFSNNLAFFFDKANYHKEAVYLLEKILEKFPKRVVAYYNLGDAYWALGEKEKAKKAYSTYIKMMKAKGKEKRIPKVVKDRVLSK